MTVVEGLNEVIDGLDTGCTREEVRADVEALASRLQGRDCDVEIADVA